MITAYVKSPSGLNAVRLDRIPDLPPDTVWLDLLQPSRSEELIVESFLGVEVPTSQEIVEIEDSSRFYQRNGTIYVTASLLTRLEDGLPAATDARFIVTPTKIISVRYVDSRPFKLLTTRLSRSGQERWSSEFLLETILELIVDDLADILEATALDLDRLSHRVFFSTPPTEGTDNRRTKVEVDLKETITEIGRYGELVSEARLSVFSTNRLLIFLSQCENGSWQPEVKLRFQTLMRDVRSLTEHATFLANRVNFLLEGTLGLTNIEQNKIIKIFSVAAVALMPPTLIASIYGMNFKFMPELTWSFGYPLAITMMIASETLPFLYFRRKGWL